MFYSHLGLPEVADLQSTKRITAACGGMLSDVLKMLLSITTSGDLLDDSSFVRDLP